MCRLFWLLFEMHMKSTWQVSRWPMGQKYSDVHVHAPWRFVSSTSGYWLQHVLIVWLLLFSVLATVAKTFSEVGDPLIYCSDKLIIEHIGLYAQPSHHPCAVREGGGGAGTMACMFCTMCVEWVYMYTYMGFVVCVCVGGGGGGGGVDRELLVHIQHI